MFTRNISGRIFIPISIIFILVSAACQTKPPVEEIVDIAALLPEGAVAEITQGHPDFKVTLVDERIANVSAMFNEKYLNIAGVEEEATRERLANYVLQYLENPNKKAEDKAKKEAYDKLPPKEKMAEFIKRMKENYPDFDYKWVGLGEGNVKLEYGDNTLLITGVDSEGAREEIAHGLTRIQKEIDKAHPGEEK